MRILTFVWLASACAMAAAQTSPQFTVSDTCSAFNVKAVTLFDEGKLAEGEAWIRTRLAAHAFDQDPACLSATLHNLATILIGEGRTSDAEAPAEQSAAILEKLAAPDDPGLLPSLQALWFIYGELNEVAKMRQACHALRALHLVSPHDRAALLSILATQSWLEGQNLQAEEGYLRAIAAWEALGSEGSVEMASLLCHLSVLYFEQGRSTEAETTMTRAVHMIGTAPGARPPQVIRIRNQEAVVHARQGRWDLARGELKELVELGESSQLSGSLLKVLYSNYSCVLRKTHHKKEARAIAARAAAIPSVSPSSSALVDITAFTNREGLR